LLRQNQKLKDAILGKEAKEEKEEKEEREDLATLKPPLKEEMMVKREKDQLST